MGIRMENCTAVKDTYTREEARALVAQAVRAERHSCTRTDETPDAVAKRLVPEPPPAFTYGREIRKAHHFLRRRSDGVWEYRCTDGAWITRHELADDAHVRALAAEVPLTDAECDTLLHAGSLEPTAEMARIEMRAAVARVLRGEVPTP